ncbi:host attachment protein [Luteolibacter arcticus]|uniref:Host attachment protein n=1 Tax=Luteolibacter arcticus TaxID=1581411 RepID=A0ABT3GNU5_9BACT|nr:host attachment protein [Luteolibacter arcticus]MCW1925158.1 host attachment protein [Luteolibacter arcticus]
MKPLPSLLVVTDRGRLLAYLTDEAGRPRLLSTTEFKEGNKKISELVTDQAGAFPNTGSVGTSSAERMPLVAEMEVRCFRKIAEEVDKLLKREGVTTWGLCAPSEIHGALLDFVSRDALERLGSQVRRDLVNSSPQDVKEAFENATG